MGSHHIEGEKRSYNPAIPGGSMLRHLRFVSLCAVLVGLALSGSLVGQSQTAMPIATEFEGLHFRSIGPATMSGRISDLAVYEANPAIYYVGTAHCSKRSSRTWG
jgi:hypothetical protein